jgi:dolichol-phosphate mannosyltransferase
MTVIVPTCNEGANVVTLVERLCAALHEQSVEILFVDDSTDDTPQQIARVSAQARLPVRMIHRKGAERVGGLAGAVTAGVRASDSEYVLVMDGDLQHPPEMVPALRAAAQHADLSVASRYGGTGNASGLSNSYRRWVSSGSTLLAQACFPRRVGRVCADPMTGFFCFRRSAVDMSRLRPRGFKILLEILARHDLRVCELPFAFGERLAGKSKASWRNGLHFAYQMASLRMGRMSRFAAVGVLGTVVNLAVMGLLTHGLFNVNYVVSAVIAAEVSILHNFLLQERFVFRDMRDGANRWAKRLVQSLAFNNVEALVRLPFLILLVETMHVWALLAQAVTLAIAFVVRFVFVSRVVYRPRPVKRQGRHRAPRIPSPRTGDRTGAADPKPELTTAATPAGQSSSDRRRGARGRVTDVSGQPARRWAARLGLTGSPAAHAVRTPGPITADIALDGIRPDDGSRPAEATHTHKRRPTHSKTSNAAKGGLFRKLGRAAYIHRPPERSSPGGLTRIVMRWTDTRPGFNLLFRNVLPQVATRPTPVEMAVAAGNRSCPQGELLEERNRVSTTELRPHKSGHRLDAEPAMTSSSLAGGEHRTRHVFLSIRPSPQVRTLAARVLLVSAAVGIASAAPVARLWPEVPRQTAFAPLLTCLVGVLPVLLLRARPDRGAPDIHDRQVDYLVGLPLLGMAVFVSTAMPARFGPAFQADHMDLLVVPAFLAGAVALTFGLRALWRIRLPLVALSVVIVLLISGLAVRSAAAFDDGGRALAQWFAVPPEVFNPGADGASIDPATPSGLLTGATGVLAAIVLVVFAALSGSGWRSAALRAGTMGLTWLALTSLRVVIALTAPEGPVRSAMDGTGDLLSLVVLLCVLGVLARPRSGGEVHQRWFELQPTGRAPVGRAGAALLLLGLVAALLAGIDYMNAAGPWLPNETGTDRG